mgnify:FL=1
MTREELNEKKQQAIFKEQNKEQIKKIVKKITKVLLIILILGTIFFSYTTYISSVKIKVREYRITNKKIPEPFNGTKIIQISDLHYGTTMFESNLKDIVKKVNERKPDIIVFTGDLIDKDYKLSSKEQEKVIKELQKLNASLGKYAILGDEDNEQFKIILNQCNFNILKNSYDLIYQNDNNPILLIGLSSDKKKQNIDKAYAYFKQEVYNSNIYTIALLHEPDTVDDIVERYNTDLFLAGHSNNGNIRIPFINYSLFKVDGAKKYDQDYYKVKDSKLFISSGLGTTNQSNIRLFCRPSINFFRLSNS